jgi:hypothetical protein
MNFEKKINKLLRKVKISTIQVMLFVMTDRFAVFITIFWHMKKYGRDPSRARTHELWVERQTPSLFTWQYLTLWSDFKIFLKININLDACCFKVF